MIKKIGELRKAEMTGTDNSDKEIVIVVNGKELTREDVLFIDEVIDRHNDGIGRIEEMRKKVIEIFRLFAWDLPWSYSDERTLKGFLEQVSDIIKDYFNRCEKCGRSKQEDEEEAWKSLPKEDYPK